MFEGKKIFVAVPYHFELPHRFKENLEHMGLVVYLLPEVKDVKISLSDTIIHGYKKFILGDRRHKAHSKAIIRERYYNDFIDSLSTVDYALIVRPDLLSADTLQRIKAKAGKMVAYQWDGMDRFPLAKNLICEFDRFHVFDSRDLTTYSNCFPATNFYFDNLSGRCENSTDNIFFVGSILQNRMREIEMLARFFTQNNFSPDIYLFDPGKKMSAPPDGIKIIHEAFSFEQNLRKLREARYLLDFKNPIHHGLSFRSFESVGFRKKLITNNELVAKYDFYHPDNIFILKDDSLEGLEEFMNKPYKELAPEIYVKYSFNNWIRYILDVGPFIPLELKD
ncbi:MAG: hypothetical protein EAS48_09670 [Chryseobacterium sp.]|nr:MAG: hypothetical protein EAS48_09670 [Chryseobacterium sp.]